MQSYKLLLTLTSFQIRSAGTEILKISVPQKMLFLISIIIFYNTIDPLSLSRIILLMPVTTQSITISILFVSYLLVSNILNQSIVISPQIVYLRQFPIEPENMLWSYILNLSMLNILFSGAYAYLLIRAVTELNISWYAVIFAFFIGTLGMALGQIHYVFSFQKGFKSIISSIGGILVITSSIWFLLIYSGGAVFCIFALAVLVVIFRLVKSVIHRYPEHILSWNGVVSSGNLLNNRNPVLAIIIIDYLNLWRRRLKEITIRSLLSASVIAYSVIPVFYTAYQQMGLISIYSLIGSSVSFLLLSTMLIKSQRYKLENHWIKKVLPLSASERLFADYLSLFLLSIPIALTYGIIGVNLFGLGFINTVKIIILEFSLMALLSSTANIFLNLRFNNKLFILAQIIASAVFISVATLFHYIFLFIWFFVHISSWLIGMRYQRLIEEV